MYVGRYLSSAYVGGILPGTGSAEAFYNFLSLSTTLNCELLNQTPVV